MNIQPIKTRIFTEGESLADFIVEHVPVLADGSVLAVTSKIVSLAEARTVPVAGTDKAALIKEESEFALQTELVWLCIKDGQVLANAGVDESNAHGTYILLPKDSFDSARVLREKLLKHYGVKNLGILITDSRTMPLRSGVTAAGLGWAGFEGVRSYEGKPDLFNRLFKFERVNVADSLATAAAFVMGEGAEQQPLAVIVDAPVVFTDTRIDPHEAIIDPKDDLYRPFFDHLLAQ
jgi:F420-0:gamma-glutamyl ligase